MAFTTLAAVEPLPQPLVDPATGRNLAFEVRFRADGEVPFPQVIVWDGGRAEIAAPQRVGEHEYEARFPAGILGAGRYSLQIEGCRRADIENAAGHDWIKTFVTLTVKPAPRIVVGTDRTPRIHFGIHKHMHQPYYDSVDPEQWDGEKDGIFGARSGPYTSFIPNAVRQYIGGGLPHAGLSTSWSTTLIDQLDRCAARGRCGGVFSTWREPLRSLAHEVTELGHPRVDFVAFHAFHALLPLIPARDIVRGVRWHRQSVRRTFGVEASRVMFPPETAFHVRIIPALVEAGVEAVVYDSIHRFRACRDYPYGGPQEGMLPPNPAEQENAPAHDWLQLHNIWAGSLISPALLRPEYIRYEDPDGTEHTIIGVPAERYIGNEDARGGFGALQYPHIFSQVYDKIVAEGTYDPKHPPFFVLHSDGDNHGGGADSYYNHNTGRLVEWLQQDSRFELTGILDYLQRFPPDRGHAVHVEPGSWSGADNGDPQFKKWFSRAEQAYSPDLNSWAVLTAIQNVVHSLEDRVPDAEQLPDALALLLGAETSCYWYWTGQEVWDRQVTAAANAILSRVSDEIADLIRADETPPTIFAPWVTPENPGGKAWGPHGQLVDAGKRGTVHTFVYDIADLRRVELVLRYGGRQDVVSMTARGPYPSQTGARLSAGYFTAELPEGVGDVRYYIEAEDGRGNIARSALERVFLA